MIKHLVRDLTPPILWNAASKLRHLSRRDQRQRWRRGTEQPPGYYDWSFERKGSWRAHYTQSHYYPLWTVVADRVRRAEAASVLDIGCGPGQVASLLYDKGIPRYLGLDFSPARVRHARLVCPHYRFEVSNVFETDLVCTWEYDCVLIMEFLEHVERDLDLLRRLKTGTRVIATVPTFAATAHVRHFESVNSVRDRYAELFVSLNIEEFANAKGNRHFLFEGILKSWLSDREGRGVHVVDTDRGA